MPDKPCLLCSSSFPPQCRLDGFDDVLLDGVPLGIECGIEKRLVDLRTKLDELAISCAVGCCGIRNDAPRRTAPALDAERDAIKKNIVEAVKAAIAEGRKMSIASKVYQALTAYKPLTRLLHRNGIYHGRSPDAGSYPVLVYSIISDVPALSVDGIELERRVTVRLHILTKDGACEKIEDAARKVMDSLGFRRYQSMELAEKHAFVKIIDFKTGVEA